MAKNWVEEAVHAGNNIRRTVPDRVTVELGPREPVPPPPIVTAKSSLWLALALSGSMLLAVLYPSAPLSAAARQVFDRENPQQYASIDAADGSMPVGFATLRLVGEVAVATVSARWETLDRDGRTRAMLELSNALQQRGGPELVAFDATGRLVGRCRLGVVEVYP